MGLENGESKTDSLLIGRRIGRFTILSAFRENGRNYCLCLCDCGKKKTVRFDHLMSERVVSCGCYQKEITAERSTKHGMKNTRLYQCWRNMKTRCYNPNCSEFNLYGGRGITVCGEWQSFEPFCEWAMANGYRDDLTIDRIDNDGNYEPSNCKWSTPKEQALNRSTNAIITYNGIAKHISEWDKDIGSAKSGRVRARLNAGWSIEKAVTTPIKRSGRHKF